MSEDLFDTDPDEKDDENSQKVIYVDGSEQPVHDGTTPLNLKTEREEVPDEGQLTYRDEHGDLYTIPDDEPVLKHIEPGQSATVQPVKGDVFGTKAGYSRV